MIWRKNTSENTGAGAFPSLSLAAFSIYREWWWDWTLLDLAEDLVLTKRLLCRSKSGEGSFSGQDPFRSFSSLLGCLGADMESRVRVECIRDLHRTRNKAII